MATYEAFGCIAAEERFARLARDGVEVVAESSISTHSAHLLVANRLALFPARRYAIHDAPRALAHQSVEASGRGGGRGGLMTRVSVPRVLAYRPLPLVLPFIR